MDISKIKSRPVFLIWIFIINQYAMCLENNLPSSAANIGRFSSEKLGTFNFVNEDLFRNDRNSGLLAYLQHLYELRKNNEIEDQLLNRYDLQKFFNNDYQKRAVNKGWNKLYGLIGKRNNEQLNQDSSSLAASSSELVNNFETRNSRASNKWNQLNSVWGKRDDSFKKQNLKGWNQLGNVWG